MIAIVNCRSVFGRIGEYYRSRFCSVPSKDGLISFLTSLESLSDAESELAYFSKETVVSSSHLEVVRCDGRIFL